MYRTVFAVIVLLFITHRASAQYTVTYAHAVTVCGPGGCQTLYFPMQNHVPHRSPIEAFATPGAIPAYNPYQYAPQRQWEQPRIQAGVQVNGNGYCGPYGCPPIGRTNGQIYFPR